jgi:hypothetical protein
MHNQTENKRSKGLFLLKLIFIIALISLQINNKQNTKINCKTTSLVNNKKVHKLVKRAPNFVQLSFHNFIYFTTNPLTFTKIFSLNLPLTKEFAV